LRLLLHKLLLILLLLLQLLIQLLLLLQLSNHTTREKLRVPIDRNSFFMP
jgi:hypothetical protein